MCMFNFPFRKYDLRIADCSECLLKEHEESIPYLIARDMTSSIRKGCVVHTQNSHIKG